MTTAAVIALLFPYHALKMMSEFKRVHPMCSHSSQHPACPNLALTGRCVRFAGCRLFSSEK